MLVQEFIQRTGFQPSAAEYSAIETVYMASDVDKDEFCKAWVRMNKTRIQKAKEEEKAREEESKIRETLYHIFDKYSGRDYMWKVQTPANVVLNTKERAALIRADIKLMYDGRYNSVSDILWGVMKYLKIA